MKKAHTHALWIYGVIVGLAIREALTHVMPFALHSSPNVIRLDQFTPDVQKLAAILLTQPPALSSQQLGLIAARLVVFLAMIVRFYFGSTMYFTQMHDLSETQKKELEQSGKRRSFGIDFLFGLAHFLLFFGWSYSITVLQRTTHGKSWFLVLLAAVLAYDFFWFLASIRYDTATYIALWTVLNVCTVGAAFVVFVISALWVSWDAAEELCFIPVALIVIIDFGDMISGKNLVTRWLEKIIERRRQPDEQIVASSS